MSEDAHAHREGVADEHDAIALVNGQRFGLGEEGWRQL